MDLVLDMIVRQVQKDIPLTFYSLLSYISLFLLFQVIMTVLLYCPGMYLEGMSTDKKQVITSHPFGILIEDL